MDVGNSLNPAIDIGATWTRGPQQAEPNKKMATFPMKKWWFSIEIIENIDIETCPENEVTDSVEMHVPEKPRCAGFLSSCLLVIYKLLKYIGVKIQCLKDTWFIFEIYWRVYDRRGLFRMSLRAKSVLARESLSLAGIMLSKSWQKYCFLGLWLNQAPSHALFFQVFTWVLLTWFGFYYYYPTRMGYSWLFCFTVLYNSYY